MKEVCHGQPNVYFLFAAMGLFNLFDGGEMVYIIPRSWTSGTYFKNFRKYIFEHGNITDIHLFASRDNVFDDEDILQETMILKVRKIKDNTEVIPAIKISCSEGSDGLKNIKNIRAITVPFETIVSGQDKYVRIVKNKEDLAVVKKIDALAGPLPSIGLKMKTGLTVNFRTDKYLRDAVEINCVPLFCPQHIKKGEIVFPAGMKGEYILDEKKSLLQQNKNYLFVKRFTSKEEPRRLQCAIYRAKQFPKYKFISTHEKVNFIDEVNGSEMGEELACGLFIVFNSTIYDTYYRIVNGSTQVNSTEINAMPVPSRGDLETIGSEMILANDYSISYCDKLLREIMNVRKR
jgi:adenine-specific DNA-methyltransferase